MFRLFSIISVLLFSGATFATSDTARVAVSQTKKSSPAGQLKKPASLGAIETNMGFDHSFASTTAVLKKSVTYHNNKQKSSVNYKAFTKSEIDKVV